MAQTWLEKLHAAAKVIEADGVGGFHSAGELVGEPAAVAMLVLYLRLQAGSAQSWPSDPKVNGVVDGVLARGFPGFFPVLSQPVALFYMSPWYCFDNFSQFSVSWNGSLAPTVEHHYQAAKYGGHPYLTGWVYEALSAHEAKKRGNDVRYRDQVRADWADAKVGVMRPILQAKYDQHLYVRKKLRQAFLEGRILFEDSPKDGFWGRGLDWCGQNWVGRLWQEIGEEQAALGWPDIDD